MLLLFIDTLKTRHILAISILLSLLLSWFLIAQTDVLSYDSLLYLDTARAFIESGLDAAVAVYPWPFMSVIVATLHQITGLSLHLAGHLLMALLYAGLICSFVLLVRELGASPRAQLIAAILLLIFPSLNDYRAYIIRDPGYWCFILLSLQQYLLYARHKTLKYACGWLTTVIFAIAFRTEGIFFAALAPLSLLLVKDLSIKSKLSTAGVLYGLLSLVAVTVLALLMLVSTHPVEKFRLVWEVINLPQFFGTLGADLDNSIETLANVATHPYIADDMKAIYLSGLFGLLIVNSFHALSVPYFVLVALGYRKYKSVCCHRHFIHIAAYALIVIFYLCLLVLKRQFMTDRFCLTLIFILMLPLPFVVEQLLCRHLWKKTVAIMLLLYQLMDTGISTGASQSYIANAAEWVSVNKGARTFVSDHEHIAYFGGEKALGKTFLRDALLRLEQRKITADWITLRVRYRQAERQASIEELEKSGYLTQLKTFANEKNDRVIIYQINPTVTK